MSYRPTVRARRLARELRTLRERRGLTLQQVADQLSMSRATVSRLETAQTRPKAQDIERFLDLYGVPSPERDALSNLASAASRRGWWTAYSDVFTGSYVAMEHEASLIRSWDPQLVHGLLQTEDYARAVITAGRMLPAPEDVERRLDARRARQALLDRPDAPSVHMVVDEAVLRRPIGGPRVLAEQLGHLAELAAHDRITIQILPFAVREHAGLDGRFTMLSFPHPADPDIAYVEGTMGDVYVESVAEIASHGERFQRIAEAALPPEESARLVADSARSST
ncbi:helix-turn-helix domain-containing protein [Actinomadura rupiterrae]|uniref:helix-turn-helix domain-containing protein n=1 Tax=Actinomadura rupiterrae TaxID=559627 RepID=UPI0020A46015|nr:helix-turn-helix transcriptional regulator [Actinomadura rupiterrae]MCP2341935.1 transcriptional regulator with XRE-family HTH domain [Actinomadura rupiterrae]